MKDKCLASGQGRSFPFAGIYEFSSREDAEGWFNEGWADWMEGRFGVRPTLTLFDNPVVLDNEVGEVRVDDAPVPAPWRDSE